MTDEKMVLSLLRGFIEPYMISERGETVVHNDDHLTLALADGSLFRITVEEIHASQGRASD